jgi:hypothetical protein
VTRSAAGGPVIQHPGTAIPLERALSRAVPGLPAHAKQAQPLVERYPPEACARRAPYRDSIGSWCRKRQVAGDRLEVREPQLDADRPAEVVLSAQILRDPLA